LPATPPRSVAVKSSSPPDPATALNRRYAEMDEAGRGRFGSRCLGPKNACPVADRRWVEGFL